MKTWIIENAGKKIRAINKPDNWTPSETLLTNLGSKKIYTILTEDSKPEDTADNKYILNNTLTEEEVVVGTKKYYTRQKKWQTIAKTVKEKAQDDLNAGFAITEGYNLGCSEADRKNWHDLRDHFKEKQELGQATDTTLVTFRDVTGQARQLTLLRFREVITALGDWYLQKWFIINS